MIDTLENWHLLENSAFDLILFLIAENYFMKNLNELCLLQDYIEFTSILKKLHSTYNWFSLKTPKGSITNTELFFIFRHIKKINPQIIFESGFFKGRSSIVLGEIMKEIGHVYCARFNYPEENYDTFEFENDYKNIHIIASKCKFVIVSQCCLLILCLVLG